jgi:hypothetical protein
MEMGYFCKKYQLMVITYEVLNEDTLPILEQLERLNLLRRVPDNGEKTPQTASQKESTLAVILPEEAPISRPISKSLPLQSHSLAGKLSSETAQKLRKHLETIRSEWNHRI